MLAAAAAVVLAVVLAVKHALAPTFAPGGEESTLPTSAARLPVWTLEWQHRIGSVDDSITGFTDITLVDHDTRGRLYVAQRGIPAIRVFEPDGRYVTTLGRGGSGPGEFMRPWYLGWTGDTLWVSDAMQSRVSFFADLEHVGDWRIPRIEGDLRHGVMGFPARGLAVVVPSIGGRRITGDSTRIPLLRVTDSGQILDTIASVEMKSMAIEITTGPRGRGFTIANPFTNRDVFGLSRDARTLVVAQRNRADRRFRLTWIDVLSGDTLLSRLYPYEPRFIERHEVETYVEDVARTADLGPVDRRRLLERLLESRAHGPVRSFQILPDRSVWVRLQTADAPDRYLVLGPDGTPRATIETTVPIAEVHGDTAWSIARDELDVSYLDRYRIVRR